MMRAISPSTTHPILPEMQLRVRIGPLLRWFFVGFFLFAEIYLASRLWGGWRLRALAHLMAIQIFFAPRLLLIGFAFSAVATLITERIVRWVARPLSARWLSPAKGLPSDLELPLFLRVGENLERSFRGRRKIEHGWEPGWLVLTDQRAFWLSGIWRMIVWELPRKNADDSLLNRFDFDPAPHWFAGFVVGMPPRLIVRLTTETNRANDDRELIALARPQELLEHLEPDLIRQFHEISVIDEDAKAQQASIFSQRQMATRYLQKAVTVSLSEKSGQVVLPPRRVRKARIRPVKTIKPVSEEPPAEVRGIQLPPRRRRS